MKLMIVTFVLSLVALSALAEDSGNLITFVNHNRGIEGYDFKVDTPDGHQEEKGTVKNSYLEVEGSYTYTNDDGKVFSVQYTADKKGFHPKIREITPNSKPSPT